MSAARQVAWANEAFAHVVLMSGESVPAILSLTEDLAVDLIVIGASGSRAPAVLTGRVRYRIQRDAPCRVPGHRAPAVNGGPTLAANSPGQVSRAAKIGGDPC